MNSVIEARNTLRDCINEEIDVLNKSIIRLEFAYEEAKESLLYNLVKYTRKQLNEKKEQLTLLQKRLEEL